MSYRRQAVSPVIATILMVAITVVLAGLVIVYVQSISSPPTSIGGEFKADVSMSVDGSLLNWTITYKHVPSGELRFAEIQWKVQHQNTSVISAPFAFSLPTSASYRLIDNSATGTADGILNEGDVQKIRSDAIPQGIAPGDKFMVLKSDTKLLEIKFNG